LIAATTVDASHVIVALKSSFAREVDAVQRAIKELRGAGWADGLDIIAFEGPHEYLYGEETALLEAIDGRRPFPRVAPPCCHGVEEMLDEHDGARAHVVMAAHGALSPVESMKRIALQSRRSGSPSGNSSAHATSASMSVGAVSTSMSPARWNGLSNSTTRYLAGDPRTGRLGVLER
jgi:hypothetical protein